MNLVDVGEGFFVKSGYLSDVQRSNKESGATGTPRFFVLNGQKVAIKKMPLNEKCFREIMFLKSCKHENIISFIDTWRHSDTAFFSMEQGKTSFLSYVEENNIKSMSEIASFASNIFAGLEYIHLRDMIHTDVKFGNIIIADNDTLKLIDFDRATPFVEAAQNSISNSRVRGTLEYEAPELSAGKNFDLKVDSWSVGVVLAECVLQTDYLFKRKSGENQNDSYRRTLDSSWQEILGECSLIKQDAKVKDSFFLLLQSLIVLDPSARLTSKDARTSDFLSKCTHLPIDPTKVTKYDPAVEKKFVINSQKIFDEELTQ